MNLGDAQTVEFVLRHVVPGARTLEVGCGAGAVAEELGRRGVVVTALDHSAEAVAAARARGVDAEHGDFLEFEGPPFDALLFSRSLHHVHPLDRAIERAAMLLEPQGVLLVEDFAVEAPDGATAQWFYGIASLLGAAGLSSEESANLPTDPLKRWADEHDGEHHIATRRAMRHELSARLELVQERSVPYLYRYFADDLAADPAAEAITNALFLWESQSIERGLIVPVGWRSVWRRPR